MGEDNLIDLRQQLASQLALHPEILFAVLYGSAAEGGPFRDLDVGLFVDRSLVPSLKDWDFAFELAADLEAAVPYPVDVRVINDAALPFCYSVSGGCHCWSTTRKHGLTSWNGHGSCTLISNLLLCST